MTTRNKIIAGTITAITLATILAGAQAACAATPPSTLTINAPTGVSMNGKNFKAYQLSGYTEVQSSNGHVTSVAGMKISPQVEQALKTAEQQAGLTVLEGENGPENTLLKAAHNQLGLYKLAQSLMNNLSALGTPVSGNVDGNSYKITVPNDGFYLVLDQAVSGVQPILMSTTINGLSFADQQLGQAIFKSASALGLHKQMTNKNGVENASIAVGDEAHFKISANMPDPTVYKGLTITDTVDGYKINQESIKVTIDGQETPITPTITSNGFTLNLDSQITTTNTAKPVVITYTATVTNKKASNIASATLTDLNGNKHEQGGTNDPNTHTNNGGDPNGAKLGNIILTKVDAGNTNRTVAGAGFTLEDTQSHTYLVKQEDGSWKRENAPTSNDFTALEMLTGQDGKLNLTGIGEGTYTLSEKKVPNGFISTNAPQATITVNHDGAATVTGTGLNGGLVTTTSTGENVNVQVKNLSSITQLPQTGGAGAIAGVAALALMSATGAGLTLAGHKRHEKNTTAQN